VAKRRVTIPLTAQNELNFFTQSSIALQPPFYFIDRVLARNESSIRVLKNITQNEIYMVCLEKQGPILPWSILLESMAQAAGNLEEYLMKKTVTKRVLLFRIQGAKFYRNPQPGDQLIITANLLKSLQNLSLYSIRAEVENEIAAECEMYFCRF